MKYNLPYMFLGNKVVGVKCKWKASEEGIKCLKAWQPMLEHKSPSLKTT